MRKRAEGYCSGGQETYWAPEAVGEVQMTVVYFKYELKEWWEVNSVETGFNTCFFLHWNGAYSKKKKNRYKHRDPLLYIGCTLQNSMLEYCAHMLKEKSGMFLLRNSLQWRSRAVVDKSWWVSWAATADAIAMETCVLLSLKQTQKVSSAPTLGIRNQDVPLPRWLRLQAPGLWPPPPFFFCLETSKSVYSWKRGKKKSSLFLGGETKRTFTESDAAGQLESRTQYTVKESTLVHNGGSMSHHEGEAISFWEVTV